MGKPINRVERKILEIRRRYSHFLDKTNLFCRIADEEIEASIKDNIISIIFINERYNYVFTQQSFPISSRHEEQIYNSLVKLDFEISEKLTEHFNQEIIRFEEKIKEAKENIKCLSMSFNAQDVEKKLND